MKPRQTLRSRDELRALILRHFATSRRRRLETVYGIPEVARRGHWPFVRLYFTPRGLAKDAICPKWQTTLTGGPWASWDGNGYHLDEYYEAFSRELLGELQEQRGTFREIGLWLAERWA